MAAGRRLQLASGGGDRNGTGAARAHPPVWEVGGRAALLVCAICHEVSCWPLRGRVTMSAYEVEWHDFQQPHRKDRDYGGLRFRFERGAYEAELPAGSPGWTLPGAARPVVWHDGCRCQASRSGLVAPTMRRCRWAVRSTSIRGEEVLRRTLLLVGLAGVLASCGVNATDADEGSEFEDARVVVMLDAELPEQPAVVGGSNLC